MGDLTTKQKGDYFENLAYAIIKQKLENFELGIIPSQSTVFQQKGYFSRDRDDEIVFDISIEVKLPHSDKYFVLYLIECKNYAKNVPIDDLEEFHSKVSQVSGLNVKGMFITNKGFSSGAYKYARSKGISLVEVNSNLTFNIILHKSNSNRERQISGYKIDLDDPFGIIIITQGIQNQIEKIILFGFIEYLQNTKQISSLELPKLSGDEIDEITIEILEQIQPGFLTGVEPLDLDKIMHFISETLKYEIIFSSEARKDLEGRHIVASVDFGQKTLVMDGSLKGDSRFSFILGHEFGHICLHNKLAISQNSYETFEDHKFSFWLGKANFTNQRQWIEWQANRFASSLLMPSGIFELFCKSVFSHFGRRSYEPLYVDDNKYSQDDFHKIVNALALQFKTTKTSIIYRMYSLNLINNKSNAMHISKIIKENHFDLFE
ncbi:restriction endonuclease [Haliscomenobacter hydrossis]|uniref:Restriction endonuclease n=1 Tax=Haliscomenobacter hydrossis (strain ATCC 27775 / DSM 1100 / LMG 10767 / O) TaxID=760192 RepID=F4KQI8_HALH1|nr:restriction endonuclease [Haliscomenobacter hydrossis]AEE49977.1 protein of unknown function DUF955 [Haliscomenobacter hydrossis DSM 1100]